MAKKKTTAKKQPSLRSFRPAAEQDFMSFRFTVQTVYWLILSVLVLALGIWVISLNTKINDIYNQIDASNSDTLVTPKVKTQ